MSISLIKNSMVFLTLAVTLFSFASCLNAKKLDKYVAGEYNNELPRLNKKKKLNIEVMPPPFTANVNISSTVNRTDKLLPLLVYWKYDHRQICSLNPSIANTHFTNAVNTLVSKTLLDKLGNRKLELTVEQAPSTFSIVAKEQLVWLIYAYSWARVYIEPETQELIVSYKVVDTSEAVKAGRIVVKNADKNQGIRWFQSWKSATSEYLSAYNANLTNVTKSFLTQLTQEL